MTAIRSVDPETRGIPMIGHPIAQVKSLSPVNAWFASQEINACMMPVDIVPQRVAAFFDVVRGWENCIGVSITLPHKQAAFAACDRLSARASVARAVNIVRRDAQGLLHGDMTDGPAFCAVVKQTGRSIVGAHVLLIGAGGAGSAVAHALAEEGAASITVIDIDVQRRDDLMKSLAAQRHGLAVRDSIASDVEIDIAFNATPLGMKTGDPMPCDLDILPLRALVADAVTKPAITPWLAEARRRGHMIQSGEEMALAQLAIQLPFWGFAFLPD